MKLFFIFVFILNFSFSITPQEILDSVNSDSVDGFELMKFSGCRKFNSKYKNLELPFYFRYKDHSLGDMWFEVDYIDKQSGQNPILDVTNLYIYSRQWEPDKDNWLSTEFYTRCMIDLGYSSNLRISYIHKPIEKIEGSVHYKDEKISVPFSDVEFYVRKAYTTHKHKYGLLSKVKGADTNDIKPSKQRVTTSDAGDDNPSRRLLS